MSERANYLYTRIREALPWAGGDPSVRGDPRKSVKWIDGLRGIASFLVILTHLARAWDFPLFYPRDAEDVPPRLLQLPILRIPWQGRIGVTIFAFLTGYVCALKPLKLSRGGNRLAAFTTIAKSAFRRPPRLILPATIALFISWVMAQCRAFVVANRSDCWWCRYAAPDLKPTFLEEVVRLFENFLSTWTTGKMVYDDHQWALLPLLMASMLVYIMLFATMFMKFRWRLAVYFIMTLYFHQDAAKDTETFQMQAIYGMFLSDLSYETRFQEFLERWRWPRRIVAILLTISGLLIASYPGKNPEWSTWSRIMYEVAQYIFPPKVNIGKRYTAIGVDLIILAIFISPHAKSFLSSRLLLWFGAQSFAVYLVHGTLLRTVLCWMLYGISGQPWDPEAKDENGEPVYIKIRPPWVVGLSIPIWIGLVYVCAVLWTKYVDPFCARLTQKLENLMFVEEEKPLLPSQQPQQELPMVSMPMPTS